jgi:hypothetical protein
MAVQKRQPVVVGTGKTHDKGCSKPFEIIDRDPWEPSL